MPSAVLLANWRCHRLIIEAMASYDLSFRGNHAGEKGTGQRRSSVPVPTGEIFYQTQSHLVALTQQADHELHDLFVQRSRVVKRLQALRSVLRRMIELYGEQSPENRLLESPSSSSKMEQFRSLEKVLPIGPDRRRFHAGPDLQRACRIALMEIDGPASTGDIYDRIMRRGSYRFGRTRRPLASMAAALNVLVRKDEVIAIHDGARRRWQWNFYRRDKGEFADAVSIPLQP